MYDKLIFEVAVEFDPTQISQLKSPAGEVLMIPFGGTVDQNGVRHMSARYMLEGVDKNGEQCRIYIDNNGWFPGEMVMPFKTIPTFFTDSKALASYLHSNKFRTEGHPRQGGVTIKVFEICNAS
jgi:hypothetical protein